MSRNAVSPVKSSSDGEERGWDELVQDLLNEAEQSVGNQFSQLAF